MTIVEQLIRSYDNRVAWGKGDGDEALIAAIDTAYPYVSDDERATLFTMLKEGWDSGRGEARKLFVKSTIQKWQYARLHPQKPVASDG